MVKRALIFALLFLIFLVQPAIADEANSGIIEGSLVNMTKGASSNVASQNITMHGYKDNAVIIAKSVISDIDGKFKFEGLPTDPTCIYEIGVTYQGADYYSEPLQFAAGETQKSAEIDIFDTTVSDEALNVMMSHAIVTYENNALKVKEYYLIINNSDRTYIGQKVSDADDNKQTLVLYLPSGATNFQSGYGLTDYKITNGTEVHDSTPISPIGREISYSYIIPCNKDSYTLSWRVKYATTRFDLLIPDGNIKAASTKLIESTPLTISNQTYKDFTGASLQPGEVLTIQLSSLQSSGNSKIFNWAWVLLILPAVAIGLFFIKRQKSHSLTVRIDKDSLLAEIAELDDSYEAKEIGEESYLRIRKEKKQQLLRLIEDEKEL